MLRKLVHIVEVNIDCVCNSGWMLSVTSQVLKPFMMYCIFSGLHYCSIITLKHSLWVFSCATFDLPYHYNWNGHQIFFEHISIFKSLKHLRWFWMDIIDFSRIIYPTVLILPVLYQLWCNLEVSQVILYLSKYIEYN